MIFADNASTTQKPSSVIQAVSDCYESSYANAHRALYELGLQVDERHDRCKRKTLEFYQKSDELYDVVFTAGTTDGINKICLALEHKISSDSNIVLTEMEHHSNLIPWQVLCRKTGAQLRLIPFYSDGSLDIEGLYKLIDEKTAIVSVVHISNTLGTKNPLHSIQKAIKSEQTHLFIDAAQSAALYTSELAGSDFDALFFSAHKMFGPSGLGAIIAKQTFLEELPPLSYGGGMVTEVFEKESHFFDSPKKHEAGTPAIAQIAGYEAAIDFLNSLDHSAQKKHILSVSTLLSEYVADSAYQRLGSQTTESGIISIYHPKIHAHDLATFLSENNIAVRAGHHCTQLIMKKYQIPASLRFSLSIYNSEEEMNRIISCLSKAENYFLI